MSLSRAFGDFIYKDNEDLTKDKQKIICKAEITEYKINEKTDFLMLGSVGVWECMENQDIIDFIKERSEKAIKNKENDEIVVEDLFDKIIAKDSKNTKIGLDNMIFILVNFIKNNEF